jgi:hypothetical protein
VLSVYNEIVIPREGMRRELRAVEQDGVAAREPTASQSYTLVCCPDTFVAGTSRRLFLLKEERWSDLCISNRQGRGRQSIWPNSASGLRSAPPRRSWPTFFNVTWKTSNRSGQPRFNDWLRGPERGDL